MSERAFLYVSNTGESRAVPLPARNAKDDSDEEEQVRNDGDGEDLKIVTHGVMDDGPEGNVFDREETPGSGSVVENAFGDEGDEEARNADAIAAHGVMDPGPSGTVFD